MVIKIIKWFAISVGILIILLTASCFIIGWFYGDEVKNYVVLELNKRLKTEIQVSSVEFSLIKKFPDASVELTGVIAKSTDEFNKKDFKNVSTDTLFTAKSLFLQFNIFDLLRKNYKLKSIEVEDGYLSIFIDKKGKDNFHFWLEDETSVESNFEIKLKKLIFNKIYLRFYNAAKDLRLRTYTNKLALAGDFASETYELSTYGTFKIDEFYYDRVNYFNTRNVNLNLDLYVNNNLYSIKKGTLQVEDLSFLIKGKYNADKNNYLDLNVSGSNLNINSFLSLLPEDYKKDINDFSSDGAFYFTTIIKGEVSHILSPHIETRFGIENGTIERSNTKLTLKNVNLTGTYSNGSKNNSTSSYLVFENFKINMGESYFEGKYRMENFKKPKVELIATGDVNLTDFQDFFRIDTIEYIKGRLTTDFRFNGDIKDLNNLTVDDFRRAKTEGKINISDCDFKMDKSIYEFSSINGDFSFKNNDIKIDSMRMIANGNDFAIRGFFNNILSYLLIDNQQLSVSGQIKSISMDIDKLFGLTGSFGESSTTFHFPENIIFDADVDVELFKFGKFIAENVYGKLMYKNQTLAASPLTFKTMDGNLKATGTIEQKEDSGFNTKFYTTLTKINITKLFSTFSDFGQDFIQEKHLKGFVSSNVSYSSDWTNSFEVDEKSIVVESDIIVENGELLNFEPMQKLSRFIALEELMNIKFATLKNDIIIKDRKITIPQMVIKSSAFEIELTGEHTFDNEINYKIKVQLSDILANKAKKAKKENIEFGEVEDDGLGRTSIYLSVIGTVDDYTITYDTKNVIVHIKESLKEEKNNLKKILNEEFGLFKKDSAIIKAKKEEELVDPKTDIKVYWDEDVDTVTTNNEENEDDW
ncbi:MAG: AsmA-like C-terminal region-containing protein [Bacteroidota bacterium]